MTSPEVTHLIEQIKARAQALEFMEDGLAFDKYLGELDLLLYKLRTAAWAPPKGVTVVNDPVDLHNVLKELFNE